MRRILFSLSLLLAVTGCQAQTKTQEYEPTLNWPYLLDDFYSGVIALDDHTVSQARLNFHLRSESLYCIDNEGKVARVMFGNINHVNINGNIYRFVNGKPMRQLHAVDDALLLDYCYIDYDLMEAGYREGKALYARATYDYGMYANWNNNINYRILHMRGEFNESYMEMRSNWYDGQKLPIRHSFYFNVNGELFRATSSECNAHLSKDNQKALKALIKKNNLKWRHEDDLITILRFMREAIAKE